MKDIKRDFSEFNYSYVEDGETYDYILLVSGCPIKCADIKKYNIRKRIIDINSDNYDKYNEIIINTVYY